MTELAHALRDTLLALTRIASPIGEEAELCDHVEERLASTLGREAITRFHDSLIVHAAPRDGAPRIALVVELADQRRDVRFEQAVTDNDGSQTKLEQ